MPPATRCERKINTTTLDGEKYTGSDLMGDVEKQDNYVFKITKNFNSKDERS